MKNGLNKSMIGILYNVIHFTPISIIGHVPCASNWAWGVVEGWKYTVEIPLFIFDDILQCCYDSRMVRPFDLH